ncbi:NRDE family protein [Coraliomargarita akajimensis]|uniref:NRDE family protein n=1 Tax=Coraliomargarita akajimensis (strain DSM 45221 / IAM 15411 / JCM 23193 / KCTC 12865 / 04OKA010-24) TaxID=583355 RepID=D5EKN8_CORAD|nr:NRDE family protein [Coraliomargarita akajimensis]ADE54945.1 conserved hypothetical protein [Coraliomargarita akajimensis DSM 45221]
MCTLSWWTATHERGVLFNRDEKRTRSRGLPPRIVESDGTRILMPLDPDAGGSWIGVNQHGLIVALLNNYPHYQDQAPKQRSRGKLVVDSLIHCKNVDECMEYIEQMDHRCHKGFLLFAMDPERPPRAREWQGSTLNQLSLLEDGGLPALTSSSVRRTDCEQFRLPRFAKATRTPEALRKLHELHTPADTALGPLMTRADAATDSITEIRLTSAQASMSFQSTHGNPPCLNSASVCQLKYRSD